MPDLRTRVLTVRVGARRALARARRRGVIDAFHTLYYYGNTWQDTYWMGVQILKCPLDLWQYQEIIYSQRPDLIIETGTARGGSALYMASIMDIIDHGRILSVDIDHPDTLPKHDRVTYITGSSVSPDVLSHLQHEASGASTVLVILDSDHSEGHVRQELEHYQHFVTPGCYMIVEDTNVNGHPVGPRFGPGPMEALNDFLATAPPFTIDPKREQYLMTLNPRGYLRRHS